MCVWCACMRFCVIAVSSVWFVLRQPPLMAAGAVGSAHGGDDIQFKAVADWNHVRQLQIAIVQSQWRQYH